MAVRERLRHHIRLNPPVLPTEGRHAQGPRPPAGALQSPTPVHHPIPVSAFRGRRGPGWPGSASRGPAGPFPSPAAAAAGSDAGRRGAPRVDDGCPDVGRLTVRRPHHVPVARPGGPAVPARCGAGRCPPPGRPRWWASPSTHGCFRSGSPAAPREYGRSRLSAPGAGGTRTRRRNSRSAREGRAGGHPPAPSRGWPRRRGVRPQP